MNWFFHKVYWTGWITHHNRRKKELTESTGRSRAAIFRGLAIIGFTSVYREGFEVVLFLQSMRLKAGTNVVLEGVSIGLALTLIVAMLTFVIHYRLPYKKMLVLTGVMLGAVLLVMVGEEVQEMQQAGWISTTTLKISMPDWLNTWLAVFPTAESLLSQLFAGAFVIGSYYLAAPSLQDSTNNSWSVHLFAMYCAGLRKLYRVTSLRKYNRPPHSAARMNGSFTSRLTSQRRPSHLPRRNSRRGDEEGPPDRRECCLPGRVSNSRRLKVKLPVRWKWSSAYSSPLGSIHSDSPSSRRHSDRRLCPALRRG